MRLHKNCLNCDKDLKGRTDKKYSDPQCKSSHQYRKEKEQPERLYNKAGKAVVRSEVLLKEGFNPKFFTHYWKNKKGDVYLFVYEYGFLSKEEHNLEKYVLIKWQDYMVK